MDKTTALATQILAGIGGEENILRLENCMTRVRVEVRDELRLDLPALKQLPGVKGYIKQGDQHQFIVGPGAAAKVVDAMRSLFNGAAPTVLAGGDDIARTKAQAKQKYAAPMSGALKKLADVFIPLIPAFIASGLITGIINLLKRPDIAGELAVNYPNVLGLLAIFGSAVFAIMNILVGVNAARVFGGSQAMGGVMAGILSSPALAQITLFGEALQPGRGGVIAVLLVVALMCWVEKRLRNLLPESIELILNPLLTTLVTASLAIMILQPLGGYISDAIAHGANLAIDKGGLLVGAVLSGLFLPLVLSGLHQGLVPIHVELVQAHGSNPLLPILAMAGVGQVGAALAVLMKTRNARLKKVIKGALPVGILGIGEPLIFGVTLPLGKPFIAACLGGAVGGALISYWKVATVITFGISGLPLALTIVSGKVMLYLAGMVITIVAGFIFTWIMGFNDPEE
ncbi:PTS transporter subunit EIIC [Serratia plymuthica]|uniref:PTS system N-acetylmuramic acid-specific EIIBC component n=1 Tax=Serratia plymuthica TaxID=82996 RepID=A0A2X4V0K8_SERPL|nr:PTS transporter subunit EIIC [Serratia plymuthica]QPS19536.1 PTS transporter subunit EIIC [Serratia plymuthica]QPS61248.1 PTS transporter subunit EIIC [Serratia plymuthica]RKS61687.1 PTS system IIB component (Glc family) /PTS system IIC component (Glc family) [Serratia plymuthica]CAI2459576.1 PTS system EIIBC component SA0186 [Serratia plymuthica]SQI44673.1 PTS system EIIBC component SA0186 [Serratia plymuthica]